MKVAALFVVLAMAMATEAHPSWPWAGLPWAGAWPGAWPWGLPVYAPGPAPVVSVDAPAVPALAATSVNANRGAVHVAPLPGHAINQQQLNLAPAPGTI
ncbi:adult cuticle protein 1-like [Toxorhynchites rutilus septentrionalis]|uniref:adult cuticle protein 1-like n=1 Tax=Toxorhynchites rutilus septentrionalis TaxID=329112 RepID=UPI002479D225|nr:adult cuticle protein 1-like [Toxorhynchites rutilus septentrionalis]